MSALRILAVIGLLLAGGQAARADATYTFTQEGPMIGKNPGGQPFPNGVVASLTLIVSDDAYENGFTAQSRTGGGPPQINLSALRGLLLEVQNIVQPIAATLVDFITSPPPGSGVFTRIDLTATPLGLLAGTVYYNSSNHDVTLTFSGTANASGRLNSDAGYGCFFSPCAFIGRHAVAVPEPAALALFGVGLASLGMVVRRRSERESGRPVPRNL